MFFYDKYIFRQPPQIPDIILKESFFQDLAFILHRRFNQLLPMLLHISCGIDLPIFLLVHTQYSFSFTELKVNFLINKYVNLTSHFSKHFQIIVSLYILSVIGSYFSSVNLLYIGKHFFILFFLFLG